MPYKGRTPAETLSLVKKNQQKEEKGKKRGGTKKVNLLKEDFPQSGVKPGRGVKWQWPGGVKLLGLEEKEKREGRNVSSSEDEHASDPRTAAKGRRLVERQKRDVHEGGFSHDCKNWRGGEKKNKGGKKRELEGGRFRLIKPLNQVKLEKEKGAGGEKGENAKEVSKNKLLRGIKETGELGGGGGEERKKNNKGKEEEKERRKNPSLSCPKKASVEKLKNR